MAIGLLVPTTAHAAPDRFDGRSIAIEAQAGRMMPLGYYGLALDASLSRHLAISGGAGFAYEGNHGTTPQFMLSSRYRIPFGRGWAAGAGGGLSFGDYIQTFVGAGDFSEQRWLPALRVNGELSLEYRFSNPLSVRLFGGIGWIVNEPQCLFSRGGLTNYEGPCRSPEVPEQYLSYDRTPSFVGLALAHQLAGDIRFTPPSPTTPPLGVEASRWQRWYGWQTLAADVAGVGLLYAANQQKYGSEWKAASKGASGAIYLTGAPAVHLAQRSPLRSLLSLVSRVALPLAGSYLLWATKTSPYECQGADCPVIMGLYVGAVSASLADAAFLAYR
jgi:hypothetical protein